MKKRKERKKNNKGLLLLCSDVLREIFKFLYTRELIGFCLICKSVDDEIYDHFLIEIKKIGDELIKELCLYDLIDTSQLKKSRYFNMFYEKKKDPFSDNIIIKHGLIYMINKTISTVIYRPPFVGKG